MARNSGDFRILDKDLGRITNVERAMAQSARPLLRLGLALGFIGTVALIALQVFADQPALGMLVAGFAVAAYLVAVQLIEKDLRVTNSAISPIISNASVA